MAPDDLIFNPYFFTAYCLFVVLSVISLIRIFRELGDITILGFLGIVVVSLVPIANFILPFIRIIHYVANKIEGKVLIKKKIE